MIDDPVKTAALIARMEGCLPIPVALTPELRKALAMQAPGTDVPERCEVVKIFDLGDEGGICCGLEMDGPEGQAMHVASLTHLRIDRRSPLFRDVEAYQRHRVKKLKKRAGRGF